MSFAADRRLNVFLKQKGIYVDGVAHVPMKTFLPLATALVQDVRNVSAVSAGKLVRKALFGNGLSEKAGVVKIIWVFFLKWM